MQLIDRRSRCWVYIHMQLMDPRVGTQSWHTGVALQVWLFTVTAQRGTQHGTQGWLFTVWLFTVTAPGVAGLFTGVFTVMAHRGSPARRQAAWAQRARDARRAMDTLGCGIRRVPLRRLTLLGSPPLRTGWSSSYHVPADEVLTHSVPCEDACVYRNFHRAVSLCHLARWGLGRRVLYTYYKSRRTRLRKRVRRLL